MRMTGAKLKNQALLQALPLRVFPAEHNGELKQQRRQRLRKDHLKNEFALLETLLHLFQLVQFIKCWQIFLELNSKRLYQSSGKEKESRCLVFTSSTQREIGYFHVVVVLQRQRSVQKSDAHAKLLFH